MIRRWFRRQGSTLLLVTLVIVLAGCQWPMAGFDPARTNFNPFEDRVNVVNVSSLHEAWTSGELAEGGGSSPPLVAGGLVYTSGDQFAVQAFDAAGTRGCSGDPKTCAPLWTGDDTASGPPLAIANGTLYAGGSPLQAFDAAGVEGCSGAPTRCAPRWTTSLGVLPSSVVVSNGFVYATDRVDQRTLYAFDAAGVAGCSGTPRKCAPLWRADGGSPGGSAGGPPVRTAVANGIVYATNIDGVFAFDAKGVNGCSGTPKTCTPLWSGTQMTANPTGPVIAHGLVFMGTDDSNEVSFRGSLVGFDAAGVQGCSGTPKRCVPIWRAATITGAVHYSPAVAGDRLYVGSADGLSAFDVDACSTSRPPCNPLWTAPFANVMPIVANGVVYVNSSNTLWAFDASGNVNCSGSPRRCLPVLTRTISVDLTAPAIASGVVYLVAHTLRALTLP
jgi:hypothetical protein